MPINSKKKGSRVELAFAHFLQDAGFPSARRTQQFCGKEGTSDVICEELPGYHIEVKGVKSKVLQRSTLLKWHNQIEVDSFDKYALIAIKANDAPWVVMVPESTMTYTYVIQPYVNQFVVGVDKEYAYQSSFNLHRVLEAGQYNELNNRLPEYCPLRYKDSIYAYVIKDVVYFLLDAVEFICEVKQSDRKPT